jgi:hypothetical protein
MPPLPAGTFTGKNMFELHVDENKKVKMFRGIWDPQDPHMGAAFGAVMAAVAAQ